MDYNLYINAHLFCGNLLLSTIPHTCFLQSDLKTRIKNLDQPPHTVAPFLPMMDHRHLTPTGSSPIPEATLHKPQHKPCFTTLPLEIRYMIYEEVFRGSYVQYEEKNVTHDPDFIVIRFEICDAYKILLASKQCHWEALRLFYQNSKVMLTNGWTVDQVLENVPEVCRKNARTISWRPPPWAEAPAFYRMGGGLRTVFPSLREVYPTTFYNLDLPDLKAEDKVLAAARKALTTFSFKLYEDHMAAWSGLRVYFCFGLRWPDTFLVNGKKLRRWNCRDVDFWVECASKRIDLSSFSYPWLNEDTTLGALASMGPTWVDGRWVG